MNKKTMIEKVIITLTEEKQRHLDMARYYRHRYDDAVEDGKWSEYVQNHLKENVMKEQAAAREMEILIDFMQELHYETEVKAK